MYFAYILQSEKTLKYYTGSTAGLEGRLKKHNSGETLSTRDGVPWKLIHFEGFETRSEAIKKEMQIKSRGAKRYLEDIKLEPAG